MALHNAETYSNDFTELFYQSPVDSGQVGFIHYYKIYLHTGGIQDVINLSEHIVHLGMK